MRKCHSDGLREQYCGLSMGLARITNVGTSSAIYYLWKIQLIHQFTAISGVYERSSFLTFIAASCMRTSEQS